MTDGRLGVVKNWAKCAKCGDVIESLHRHDFKTCKCSAISVDDGKDYWRRVGNWEDFLDPQTDRPLIAAIRAALKGEGSRG